MLLLVRFPVEVYVGYLSCEVVVGDGGGEFGGDVACVRAIVVNGELACALAAALELASFIVNSSSDNALLKLFVRLVVLVLVVVVVGFVGSGFARLNRLDGGVVGVGLVTALFSLLRFVSFIT